MVEPREEERAPTRVTSRRRARKKIFEILYEFFQRDSEGIETILERALTESLPEDGEQPEGFVVGFFSDENERFIREVCLGVARNAATLDQILTSYPYEWTYNRIAVPERIILRIALQELIYTVSPMKVIVNEALNLAKAYAEKQSNKFINGILGSVVKDLESIKRSVSLPQQEKDEAERETEGNAHHSYP